MLSYLNAKHTSDSESNNFPCLSIINYVLLQTLTRFPYPLIQMSKPHLQCVSFWLIGYLIVYVVEKYAGIQWVILNELNWNLVGFFASLKTDFLQLKLQLHCDYVPFLKFKALNSCIKYFYFIVVFSQRVRPNPSV